MLEQVVISRRGLIRSGGLTISLGALVAACGDDSGATAPGRVGNAPVPTPLSNVEVNDAVLLRTATSIEYTMLDIYAELTELGYFGADVQPLIDRLVEDHTEHVEQLAELTTAAGGEPFECANPFFVERFVEPMITNITGDDGDVPPSDDPARDALAAAEAWESLAAATYQNFVATIVDPELRQELIMIGAAEARHAAAVAMRITGTPEAYLSPALAGEEVAPDESGLVPVYAVPSTFGSLAPLTLTVGAPNDVGTRPSLLLQTPAENSFVYEGQSCDA